MQSNGPRVNQLRINCEQGGEKGEEERAQSRGQHAMVALSHLQDCAENMITYASVKGREELWQHPGI